MNQRLAAFLRERRVLILSAFYAVMAALSFHAAYDIRFDFAVPPEFMAERRELLVLVVALKLLALILARQMGSMVTFFGVPDFLRLMGALLAASAVLLAPRLYDAHLAPPRGVVLIDFLLCLAALCGFRLSARMWRERVLSTGGARGGKRAERVVIIGAGDTGASLVRELIASPARGFRPVAIFDDDATKHGTFIHGIRVEGSPEDFGKLESLQGITRAIIAIPSAPQKRIAAITLYLSRMGVHVETVPALEDLASGRARVSRVRPVEISDLLGRTEVALDLRAIRHLLEDRTVLVTGAGGSIGSELCRQILRCRPRRLLAVEQAEPSLFALEQEVAEGAAGAQFLPLVADILDGPRMEQVFRDHAPHIVFHAAAHKHVYLMERHPGEAIKNNAIGTRQVAALAIEHGAEAFVLISTDKAVNPTNVMGASKRLAELHLLALHERHKDARPTKLMAVRFGNVLGSSGSVVPIFRHQIEAGGPVTVTHPEVMRYFMTIPEAVGLVLQASAMGTGGEIFVLDMGEPVKIVDLARNMIELSGYRVGDDIEIVFTGLKPGEKLFEELRHSAETHAPTAHPRIMRFLPAGDATDASSRAIDTLEPKLSMASPADLKRGLQAIVPEYAPFLD